MLPRRLAVSDIDVLVLVGDIARPLTSKLLRRLLRQAPAVRTVVVSPDRTGNGARRALNLGADGFVAISQLDGLAAAVEAVYNGLVCVPRAARRTIAKPSFSQREKEILALIDHGLDQPRDRSSPVPHREHRQEPPCDRIREARRAIAHGGRGAAARPG